jgi:nitrogen fixation/metabolism regulation signal transduction histidine kinase
MVFLVVATICALDLFGDGLAGFGRTTFVVGAIAVVAALVLAAAMARSVSRPLTQMTQAVAGVTRGERLAIPSEGGREMATLSAAFAELSSQLGSKQDLLENTVESIRDAVVVVDENAVIVVADSGFTAGAGAARRKCR